MKLKKISAICARSRSYHLLDRTDTAGHTSQWLSDGSALYPLDGLPLLDEDSLCKLFDISEKRRENLSVRRADITVNVEDSHPSDTLVESMKMDIVHDGMELLPLRTSDGILFIQRKYLVPLEDEAELIQLYLRRANDATYIVAKAGLFIRAAFFPVNAVNRKFVNALGDILRECRSELARQEREEARSLTWTEESES